MSDDAMTNAARKPEYDERTMQDDLDRLREAWLDLAYSMVKAVGIVALVRRLGMQPKAWVTEREARDGD